MTMYKIERRPGGYLLSFSGNIEKDEMQRWYNESKIALVAEKESSFGVVVDMRSLHPLQDEAKTLMVNGQQLYKNKGMRRSAVILANSDVCRQFKNLAVQSGIYVTERYIDASSTVNAVDRAIDWVKNAVEPDR
jgi:hypothetical protein